MKVDSPLRDRCVLVSHFLLNRLTIMSSSLTSSFLRTLPIKSSRTLQGIKIKTSTTVCSSFVCFWFSSHPAALVLRETLEAIRQRESAESWTEVIAHLHFYPDLHGPLYL
jgi:hypothetical protein